MPQQDTIKYINRTLFTIEEKNITDTYKDALDADTEIKWYRWNLFLFVNSTSEWTSISVKDIH